MPQVRLNFDDELRSLLEGEAAAEGVAVDAYVREAVLMRLMLTLQQRRDPKLDALLEHLRVQAVEPAPSAADPSVAAVIDDPERLRALDATGLLDSPPEESFDRVTRLAAEALGAPSAAISLVDDHRQFFKSGFGLPEHLEAARETPLSNSVCQYAVGRGESLIVEDAREDAVISRVGSVEAGDVLSYIGIPLVGPGGHAMGTLCVWDTRPREWTRGHVQILEDLARMAAQRIAARTGDAPAAG